MRGEKDINDIDLAFWDEAPESSSGPVSKQSVNKPAAKTTGDDGLDLSFFDKPAQKQKQKQPAPVKTVGDTISDFVTGKGRRGAANTNLPEIQRSGIFEGVSPATIAKVTPALLTATNPEEIAKILKENIPDLVETYDKDESGNVYSIYTNPANGNSTIINRPGISGLDVMQGAGLAGLFIPASRAAQSATTVPAKIASVTGRAAALQSGIEGAQLAAGGEFNPEDIATAAVGAGLFEGVAQGLGVAWPAIKNRISSNKITDDIRNAFKKEAQNLGIRPEEVTDDVIKLWASKSDNRSGLEREFGVTLSNANRSGDQIALAAEDSFRSGIKGEAAQREFLIREAIQNKELTSAAARTQAEIAKNSPIISSREEVGGALAEGVREAERVADAAISEAYSKVGNASLSPDGFLELLRATRKATDGIEYPKVGNVQAWQGLQKQLADAESALSSFKNKPNAKLKPAHIDRLESIRKAIGNSAEAAGSMADKRNILAMKSAFDEKMDDLVVKGMFSGDDEALEALKSARGVFRDYMVKFGQNTKTSRLGTGRDEHGQFLKKIILENPTDAQVIDSLFTVSGFNKKAAANLAVRYKNILGKDSDEWGMVRQAAFDQIVAKKSVNGEMIVDGAKTYSNLMKVQQQNSQLLKEIFSGEEIMKIRRFAALAKKTAPELVKSRQNPSGSGVTLLRNAKSLTRFIRFIDFGASAATEGAIIFRNARNASAAKKAFRPFSKQKESIEGTFLQGTASGSASGQSGALLEKLEQESL